MDVPEGFRPITRDQVDAALELRTGWLKGWANSAHALYAMRDALPGSDLSSVLGRVAAVNSLYNAGVSSVMEMAQHIVGLEQAGELTLDNSTGPAIVRRIAHLPDRKPDAPGCQVFASKYAHFFISPERFPIYDQHAARALMRHWGVAPSGVLTGPDRYERFCELMGVVTMNSAEITDVEFGDLDAYLWLAGVYRAWHRKRAGLATEDINRDTAQFFSMREVDPDVAPLLRRLTSGPWFMESTGEVAWPS